ncbi:DNA-3-methyladenine glycosylase [Sedimentibacter sp.]|uniref:DNA-3-methyladenine glycosylase family protein n=1 Tax=Sedimentibacter sp. TaxID=1960295 RepID=UPI0028A0AE15|nr:DNA-3-methyladenine glycosylase [Sedimentibacter sp.]
MFFEYGDKEIEYLKKRDKKLGEVIDRIGHIYRPVDTDLFSSVIHHIIGQQISTKAQETVWRRLCDRVGSVNAEAVCSVESDELQGFGMTYRKAGYIKDFAERVRNGETDLNRISELSDDEVVKELSSIKGIGVWTAEMIMIFSMHRPDIVSFGDLAIIRGMRMLYRHKIIDRKRFERYRKRYSPYGTVASLYLWAVAGGAIPEIAKCVPKKKKEDRK